LTELPAFSNVGTYTTYVKVSRANYNDFYGSADVVITPATIEDVSFADASVAYDGTAKSITVSGTQEDDVVLYSEDGEAYAAAVPEYTNVGEYTVYAKVQRANYADWTGSATLTITDGSFNVTFEDASVVYDGTAKSITVSGTQEDDTVLYSEDGETYAAAVPEYTNVGEYTVYAKVQRANYADWTGSATLTITPAAIEDVSFVDATVDYDGTAKSITVSGTQEDDTVLYSEDGEAYATAVPEYTEAGAYTVYAKVQRANYADWTGSATLTITHGDIEDVVLAGYEGTYDGAEHTITVTDPSAATDTILYSLDGETYDLTEAPAFKFGENTVYVKVSRAGYNDWTGSAKVSIGQAQLTVSGTAVASKVYDGTTDAEITLGTVSGVVGEDAVTVTASGAFESAAIGDYNVEVTYAISGDDAAYYLAPAADTVAASIVLAEVTGKTVVYKGAEYKVSELVEVVPSEGLSIAYSLDGGATWVGADTAAGKDAGDYEITVLCMKGADVLTATVTATIAPADIDDVTLTGWTGDYDGEAHSITVTDPSAETDTILYSLDGETYDLTENPTFTAAGVYKVWVMVSRDNYNDWTGSATVTIEDEIGDVVLTGYEGTYDGAAHSITVTDPSAATDTILYSLDGETYDLTEAPAFKFGENTVYVKVSRAGYNDWTGSAKVSISAAQLTVSGTTVADKVYDGTADAEITLGEVSTIFGEDDVTVTASGAFGSAAIGDYQVEVTYAISGADAAYYLAPAAETIEASIVLAQVTGKTVVYKGAEYKVSELVDVVPSEGLSIAYSLDGGATWVGADTAAGKDAVEEIQITVLCMKGADVLTTTVNATIAKAQLTVSGTVVENKPYDGTPDATITVDQTKVVGVVGTDVVTVTASGAFGSAEVGDYEVEVTYALSGADAANYIAPAPETISASITAGKIDVELTGYEAVYDGAAHGITVTVTDADASDKIFYSEDGETWAEEKLTYNFGEHTVYVKVTRDNYSDWTGSAAVKITAKALTVSGTEVEDREYDGTTAATVNVGTVEGVVGTDDVTVTASGVFAGKDASEEAYDVAVTYALTGEAAGYYIAPDAETIEAAATISRKQLTVEGTTSEDKVYDKTAAAKITVGTVSGVAEGETVTVTAAGVFVDEEGEPTAAVGEHNVKVIYEMTGDEAVLANYIKPADEILEGYEITEYQEEASMVVTTTEDVVDPMDDLISLREALTVYYGTDGCTTVTFAEDLKDEEGIISISLNSSLELGSDVEDGVEIDGAGNVSFENLSFAPFALSDGADVTFTGLTFKGNTGGNGGVISANGSTLTVTDCIFIENTAGDQGGAIRSENSVITIDGCTFTGNTAGGQGGAIRVWSDNKSVTITDSTFTGNSAQGQGGAVWLDNSSYTIDGCAFTENTTEGVVAWGAGLFIMNSTANSSINACVFDSNTATGQYYSGGGAVCFNGGAVTMSAEFTGNQATTTEAVGAVWGGAIYSGNCALTLDNCLITGNTASFGEGIESDQVLGGGIYLTGNQTVYINQCLIAENEAAQGGGLYVADDVNQFVWIYYSTISANSADKGAGIYTLSSNYVIPFMSIVCGNDGEDIRADGSGQAYVYSSLYDASAIVGNYEVLGNSYAVQEGDVVFAEDSYELADNSVAIDGTGNAGDANAKDLAGNPRYQGLYQDFGAYEYQGNAISITPWNAAYDGKAHALVEVDAPEDITVKYTCPGIGVYDWVDDVPEISNAGNYSFLVQLSDGTHTVQKPGTSKITPLQLTVTGSSVADKVYDGTTAAKVTDITYTGEIIEGDDVTVTAAGVFDGAEIGTHTVKVTYYLTGEDARNYSVTPVYEVVEGVKIIPAVEVAVTLTASVPETETIDVLPESITSAESGDVVYAQIWVRNIDGSENGISGGFVNVAYSDAVLTAESAAVSSLFDMGLEADLANFGGLAVDAAASYGVGSWALLGTVTFTVSGTGEAAVAAETAARGEKFNVSRSGEGVIVTGAIQYDSAPLDATLGVPTIETVASYGANRHQVSWTAVGGAAAYTLAYTAGDPNADGAVWTEVTVAGTSTEITGLAYGAKMTYKVKAVGGEFSETAALLVCPMDINGDGSIDGVDRSILTAAFFSAKGNDNWNPAADIDGDGVVGPGDYAFLTANWLADADADDLVYPAVLPSPASLDAAFESIDPDDLSVDFDMF
ncbi:MAG: hypothetical protein IJG60_05645, partial [Thermoguttaceae bacterium]|nr:hypothetical protein [Thermoguttaceae bacterium]